MRKLDRVPPPCFCADVVQWWAGVVSGRPSLQLAGCCMRVSVLSFALWIIMTALWTVSPGMVAAVCGNVGDCVVTQIRLHSVRQAGVYTDLTYLKGFKMEVFPTCFNVITCSWALEALCGVQASCCAESGKCGMQCTVLLADLRRLYFNKCFDLDGQSSGGLHRSCHVVLVHAIPVHSLVMVLYTVPCIMSCRVPCMVQHIVLKFQDAPHSALHYCPEPACNIFVSNHLPSMGPPNVGGLSTLHKRHLWCWNGFEGRPAHGPLSQEACTQTYVGPMCVR